MGLGSFLDGAQLHAERENGWYLKITEAHPPLGSTALSTLPECWGGARAHSRSQKERCSFQVAFRSFRVGRVFAWFPGDSWSCARQTPTERWEVFVLKPYTYRDLAQPGAMPLSLPAVSRQPAHMGQPCIGVGRNRRLWPAIHCPGVSPAPNGPLVPTRQHQL